MSASLFCFLNQGIAKADVSLVSVDSTGQKGNAQSNRPDVSADGGFVIFASYATNLGSNGNQQIVVKDLQTGAVDLVSKTSAGVPGDNLSTTPIAISASGRYVTFSSYANDLVIGVGDAFFSEDVYWHDRDTDTTKMVSVKPDGMATSGEAGFTAISGDGRWVAFRSNAADLTADAAAGNQVYLRDMINDVTTLVSRNPDGTPRGGGEPDVSSDGRYVSYRDDGAGVYRVDTWNCDAAACAVVKANVDNAGNSVGGHSSVLFPKISGNGNFVTWESNAAGFVANDSNGFADIFVRDIALAQTTLVSVASDGTQGNNNSLTPDISDDGRYVSFSSTATNLINTDNNGSLDVFVHNRQTGETIRVSEPNAGGDANTGAGYYARMAGGGAAVAFSSISTDLVPEDNDATEDVYLATVAPPDNPPTADAGVDQSVAVGTTVALSGASSSDDNTPTAALDFAWSFVSKPAGSEATIANPALGSTSFLADMPGDYVVQLIVTDNLGQDSAADEMQVAAEIDPAFVFERLTTGGTENVTTYDYDDGSREYTSTVDYHYEPFLRNGNVAALRVESDYYYNTATGVYERNYARSVDLLQSAQGAPTGTLVKEGETPIPGTSNAVFSYLYPRGFVDSKFVFNGSGCGEEGGVRRCTGGEFERDLTAGAVVARRGVETPVPVDGAADPLTRVWRHYGGYYWYGRYLTNELWGGSDGRIVRTETYTYEYNNTLYTYTRRIQHRGIFTIDDTIDGGLATTVVDNEMQVPLAAPGTLFYYFGSAVIDTTSGVTAFVGSWYDTTEARYRQGLFTADTFGTITRILDDNDPQWFRGWYTRVQVAGGYVYFSGYRYESGNLNNDAWWSSYERGIYRSAGAGVEPVVTGKTQYFRDWESRDCGYVYTYLNTYHWYALPDGAVFNRSNYASDCAVGDYSSTNEGIVWRENGVDYPVVQTYNTEILGTTYRSVYLSWIFGQGIDGRTLAFNAGDWGTNSCTYDATENSTTCQSSSTRDTLLARFDSDRDGRGDDVDNCPLFPNPDQTDSDGNGIGDPCEDSDDDTVPDGLDNCPLDPNPDQQNSDLDPYGNACDVCPNDTDDQSDIDGDGLGDACDPNSDADTINDEFDNCPFIANEDQANLDGDLLGDLCDPDVDGDGIANAIDGLWDGTTFTDQSAQSSRNFSDHDLGGISYGRVLQAANGTLIEDSPDPTRGVEINTVNSSGQTSIKQCDFVGREATLVVPQGTIKVLDCGSINLESLMNGGFLVLDGDIVIDVPTATAASVTDLGDGDFAVANTSETSLPIEMNLGSDVSVTVPSGSTGQVCEPEEGQYEIQNSPDSVEPIVAEVNGVTYVYEPGDIGVPVEVDILPESAENVVYIGRRGGSVDVAILSSAVFDAVQVDLATVSLSGASVKASRKNKAVADEIDANGDGLIDLLFKVEAKDIELEDDETAVLTAMTYGGVAVFGSDVVTVVVTGGR